MLTYHPALDAYHCAFRILRLLAVQPGRSYPRELLRILDFYFLFPHLVSTIRLPQAEKKWKHEFDDQANIYWYYGETKSVFNTIEPLQDYALDLLFAKNLIDNSKYLENNVILLPETLQTDMLRQAHVANEKDSKLVQFLVDVLGAMTFFGKDGLKARSGLLEYRYDAV